MSTEQNETPKDAISIVVARPRPPTVVRKAQRWMTVARHYIWLHVRSPKTWLGLIIEFGPFVVVVTALFRLSLKWGAASTLAFMIRYLYRMWRDGRRSAAPVERNATARSVELTALLTECMHGPIRDAAQLDRFRCNVLKLIASYVRDHRCDSIRPTIYANLLVEDGADLCVLARDSDHREHMARHPKSRMLAWTAMVENQAMYTGDLYKEFPDTPSGKPYRSILVIPVRHQHRVVGVVSVDSSARYHFDLYAEEFVAHLAPFLALLGWTLVQLDAKLQAPQKDVGEQSA